MTTVRIPTPLRSFTGGAREVAVDATTVGSALRALAQGSPDLLGRIFDAQGRIRPFVNVFVGDKDVRHLDGLDTPIAPSDVLSIIPAVAGGRGAAPGGAA